MQMRYVPGLAGHLCHDRLCLRPVWAAFAAAGLFCVPLVITSVRSQGWAAPAEFVLAGVSLMIMGAASVAIP